MKGVIMVETGFTDDKAACLILSQEAFVMLLAEPFFETFEEAP